ncbi:hypothetical protein B0H12DRAFT_1098016 [Mycena haematopus]|nr:hypothetical protein B0H12DRAFT_1098016 [Mycena haematopus]
MLLIFFFVWNMWLIPPSVPSWRYNHSVNALSQPFSRLAAFPSLTYYVAIKPFFIAEKSSWGSFTQSVLYAIVAPTSVFRCSSDLLKGAELTIPDAEASRSTVLHI